MLTINCLFLSRAHDRNKSKVSKGLSVRKIYTNIHMPQFFQPMLLNSKFLRKKGASSCAGKRSCTISKKNVLKAFLISLSIVNKPVNCH